MTIDAYISSVCQHCGLEPESVTVKVEETDSQVVINIDLPEEEVGLFIGYKGETLQALQRLTRLTFKDTFPEKRIVVNLNNYREEKIEQLKERVTEVARQVVETGDSYRFPYLSSYERYIVHTTLSENPDFSELESESEGENRDRRLIIKRK